MTLLAEAAGILEAQGYPLPIVVGGSAVEFYTAGDIASGDIDVIYEGYDVLAAALIQVGFKVEDRSKRLKRGFYHPDCLIAVEVVSGRLFEGRTDKNRLAIIPFDQNRIILPPIEDLIADRLAQYEESECLDEEMLNQAKIMLKLAENLEKDYLIRRISEEVIDQDLIILLGV